jgi:3-oxoacyl-[acyl-carrier protein] reductase
MTFDFHGQTALVTGGTKGIGNQISRDLHRAGANIIVTGRNSKSFESIRSTFDKGNGFIEFLNVDFSKSQSTKAFLSELEKFNKVDILVNNVGINRIGYIDETSMKDWEDVISVNLKAPFALIRQVSKNMKKHRYGRIINIGSIFGVISKPKRSIYSMTKHGIHGLTIACALDLAPFGILVNTVSPGFVLTELTRSILSKKEIKDLAKQVPLNRFAQPNEISPIVLFLASTTNTYITSQNIVIDGGFVNV